MSNLTESDLVRTKSDEEAVNQGCRFRIKRADAVRFFFESFLCHSKGSWAHKPFTLLDWQWREVVAPLFGWIRPDGTRRFRRCGVGVPKKNGKSTLCAGLGLYMLAGDGENGAEVYSAASDKEQASIIYGQAADMVEASPMLGSELLVRRYSRRILFPGTASVYRALSADVPTKEGLNISCLLFDELHAQRNRLLWDTLRYGGAARRQPLFVWISTAGVDRQSVGYDQWQYARGIIQGSIVDPYYLAYLAEATESDDWTAPVTWQKANPSYHATLSASDFASDCEEAKRSPVEENTFKRYRLNLWTRQTTTWISLPKWDANQVEFPDDILSGCPCYAGLDLSATTDISALCLLFKNALNKEPGYHALYRFWLPEDTLAKRARENSTRFDLWAARKQLLVTPGNVVDYGHIREEINKLAARYRIKEIGMDPWNSMQLASELIGDGFKVKQVRQGFASLSAATKEFEKLVLAGLFRHQGNPVMNWMVGNVAVEQDAAGNIKPSKKRSAEKIDGIAATVTALALTIVQAYKPSRYEQGGLDHVEATRQMGGVARA